MIVQKNILLLELCQSFPSISWLTFEIIEVYGFFSRFKKKHSANYTIGLFVNMDEITLDNDGDVMAVQAER